MLLAASRAASFAAICLFPCSSIRGFSAVYRLGLSATCTAPAFNEAHCLGLSATYIASDDMRDIVRLFRAAFGVGALCCDTLDELAEVSLARRSA